jgi:hypothetical protein
VANIWVHSATNSKDPDATLMPCAGNTGFVLLLIAFVTVSTTWLCDPKLAAQLAMCFLSMTLREQDTCVGS